MTEAQKMDSRSDELNLLANEVYDVVERASKAGFALVVSGGTYLDLLDPETGEQTPIWMMQAGESA
jgi:hypothetical protein